MSDPQPKGQLNLLPEDDYEVLIESIEPRMNTARQPYVAARCIIQDAGEHKGRVVFWCISKGWTNDEMAVLEASLHLYHAPWIPRYASAQVVRRSTGDNRMYNHVKRLVMI